MSICVYACLHVFYVSVNVQLSVWDRKEKTSQGTAARNFQVSLQNRKKVCMIHPVSHPSALFQFNQRNIIAMYA